MGSSTIGQIGKTAFTAEFLKVANTLLEQVIKKYYIKTGSTWVLFRLKTGLKNGRRKDHSKNISVGTYKL